ncbi:MAG: HD domain-containing protein [Planctomycetes bacterium]|nr:HD domain-containing protein [Planctomycetota bacterium]
MDTHPKSPRRGLSLPARLCLALMVAAFFVAILVAFFGAQRRDQDVAAARSAADREFATVLAERLAVHMDRQDLLRVSVLATAARDLGHGRVLVLDHSGRVLFDTSLVLGERQLGTLTHAGPLQRQTSLGDEGPFVETLAPIRLGGEVIGELRLQRSPQLQVSGFDFGMFAAVFLCCLTLVIVATILVQHWSQRVRRATDALIQLAAGQPGMVRAEPAPGELQELDSALREMERGVQEGLHRVGEGFVALALQVVDGLERRDISPAGHGERTARYAATIAGRLHLLPEDRRELDLACRLCDLGKAWVRPALLQKRGQLGDAERRSLQAHPVRAAEHLDCLPGLRRVAAIVRHQGERYDGLGAPDALRGDRIPLGARVLALASAFDLLTTCGEERALDWQAAVQQLLAGRGEVFDPWLLDLFVEELRKAPPVAIKDRPVMILPAGAMPARARAVERDDESSLVVDAEEDELEVLTDDAPSEEPS